MTTYSVPQSAAAKPTTPAIRGILLIASLLVFTIGVPLYLLSEQTDVYFAWTIQSALTAAFLGGAYWASFALEFFASREAVWARARIAIPAVLVFTTLTLVVTLLHIDRFHFNAPALHTRLGTWVWLAVYAVVPVVLSALLVRQMRASGGDPPHLHTFPAWMGALLIAQATLLLVSGIALLIAPLTAAPLWPWALTALTARAIGAWLIGLGIAVAHAAWENDFSRVRPIPASAITFSGLQLVALARYGGEMRWNSPSAWVYVVFLLSFLGVGVYGWRQGRASGGYHSEHIS